LKRLAEARLRCKKSKCIFGASKVTYLGYIIDGEGLHPTEEKIKAIKEAPVPTGAAELKSWIGLVMYYSRFISNHASLLSPLYELLQKSVKWRWTYREQQAFETVKAAITENTMLVHFDPKAPIVLACDASPTGIAAALSHVIEGIEKPVIFVSRTLTAAERNYPQVQREALACVFAVNRLRQYLLGRHFTIVTDNQPIVSLFNPNRQLPAVAAARILRWSLVLSGYQYDIKYRKAQNHGNVDAINRLSLPHNVDDMTSEIENPPEVVLYLNGTDAGPIKADKLATESARDPVLATVIECVRTGHWPSDKQKSLDTFWQKRNELSFARGILLWGTRVVVPTVLIKDVLKELHAGHQGASHMKALARSYVWWPCIDAQLETEVAMCEVCQRHAKAPPSTAIRPWPWPVQPWSRLHIDFLGRWRAICF
jgi:hypothetical protein